MPGYMWKFSALVFGLLVLAHAGEDLEKSTCSDAIPDDGNDHCELLQKNTRVLNHQKGTKGLPDLMKDVADSLGGDKLNQDFEAIASEVNAFSQTVYHSIEVLANNPHEMSLEEGRAKVKLTYEEIHTAAVKFMKTIEKANTDFMTAFGKAMPEGFKSELQGIMGKIIDEGNHFAESLEAAATGTAEATNETVCENIKSSIELLQMKAEEVASQASKLSKHGLSEGLKTAIDKLPDSPAILKSSINSLMEKANLAAEGLETLPKQVQEIAKGVTKALGGKVLGSQGERRWTAAGWPTLDIICDCGRFFNVGAAHAKRINDKYY